MANSETLMYLLMGVAGIGVLMALIVVIAAFVQRSMDKRALLLEKAGVSLSEGGAVPVAAEASTSAWSDAAEEPALPMEEEPEGVVVELKEGPDMPKALAKSDGPHDEDRTQRKHANARRPQDDMVKTVAKIRVAVEGIQEEEPISLRIGEFRLRACAAKHIGARKEQQDALRFGPSQEATVTKSGFLSVICDGMGGMKMGGEAAELAARVFVEGYLASTDRPMAALSGAVEMANAQVWEMCRADDLTGAGTTLVAVLVTQEGFHYISVGDSHIYLMRGGVLSQLNVDHNYLSELLLQVRRGEITREQALSDPERAHLTSYLGLKKLALVDRSSGPVQIEEGDRILLASDGLFKVLSPGEIAQRIGEYKDDAAAALIAEVLKYNYRNQDNVSVMLIALDKAQDEDASPGKAPEEKGEEAREAGEKATVQEG